MKDPMNELERAFAVAMRGAEGRPELFRQLRESMLTFLMPYHPEMEGIVELGNGDTMTFSVWQSPKGQFIPVFTSLERATRAIEATGAPDHRYAVAEMKGEWLFHAISGQKERVVINPACGTGEMYLDGNAVKMLADGSILKPMAPRAEERGALVVVEAADYPTDFIQPLFQFLRGRSEVRAAWIFREETPADAEKPTYVFGLLGPEITEELTQDFGIVATGACPPNAGYGLMSLSPDDPAEAAAMAKFPPFYAAPDYRAPGGMREEAG